VKERFLTGRLLLAVGEDVQKHRALCAMCDACWPQVGGHVLSLSCGCLVKNLPVCP